MSVVLVPATACLVLLCLGVGYVISGDGPLSAGAFPVLPTVRHTLIAAFLVTVSPVDYRKATLRNQVRDGFTVSGNGPGVTSPAVAGPPGPGGPAAAVAPSRSLVGCVLHLTGDVRPSFVDRATYQARPAYVIAIPGEAWVVGINCTAARPSVITSVRLTAS